MFRLTKRTDRKHRTYLNSKLSMIETSMREIEVASTISGLTLTPSVSSSKKRSNPALEAGRGFSFFLLLLILFHRIFLGANQASKIGCAGMIALSMRA